MAAFLRSRRAKLALGAGLAVIPSLASADVPPGWW